METSTPSDADLLAQVADGDESALRALVERHFAWLFLRLRRRTPDEELAASALQDTFVAVWRSAGRYRGDGEVGAWLWGIAVRQLITRLRRRPGPVPVSEQVVAALTPHLPSAEEELLLGVEHGDLACALQRLSPELRHALVATVVDGLSTREAALLLGVPQGTVKSRVRLAKAQIPSLQNAAFRRLEGPRGRRNAAFCAAVRLREWLRLTRPADPRRAHHRARPGAASRSARRPVRPGRHGLDLHAPDGGRANPTTKESRDDHRPHRHCHPHPRAGRPGPAGDPPVRALEAVLGRGGAARGGSGLRFRRPRRHLAAGQRPVVG